MAVFAADLWWNGGGVHAAGPLMEMAEFLAYPAHWRILADLFGLALCAGVYVVPLYVIMQAESEEAGRSRVVAANNIVNALFIVVAGGGSALMLKFGSGVPAIFLGVGLLNAALAAAILIKTRR
jgi:acyl-[acyl-carrier-protein]-phospholipid O-acyltransferase / long-chain-fatty-acid--[acyl-carrier-protein] ligase